MSVPQFQDRKSLETHQLKQLRALLKAVRSGNPFYREKFKEVGSGDIGSLDDFKRRYPFTTKSELIQDQAAHEPFGSNLTFPLHNYTRCHQTSGSTGRPIRWLDTNDSWGWMLDNWSEVYRAAGTTEEDRIFFAFSFGPFLGFWTAFESALRIGCLCLPGGGMSSRARLQAILSNQATVLCCTPTYALRLAESALSEGIDLNQSRIKTIIVAGEPGGSLPGTRKKIESLWNGARVFDHHGMTEVGPVTHECPGAPGHLRVIEPSYLPEVIDPETGQPLRNGVEGELVLTTLGRTGSPLIRYRTGDLVCAFPAADNPDGCTDMCLKGGILGRVDDMVLVRGVNVYPSAIEQLIRECGGIEEYQVRIGKNAAMNELEIRVETGREDGRVVTERLARLIHERLNLRATIRLAEKGELPRFEMKARRWILEGQESD